MRRTRNTACLLVLSVVLSVVPVVVLREVLRVHVGRGGEQGTFVRNVCVNDRRQLKRRWAHPTAQSSEEGWSGGGWRECGTHG